jgi:uncharacterized membrane protein YhaH (DUF805 family)
VSANLPATTFTCTRCGADVPGTARYCASCGQAIEVANPSPPIYATAPTPMPTTILFPDSGGGIGKLFSATGRIGRLEYFLTVLLVVVVAIATWGVLALADMPVLGFMIGVVLWVGAWVICLIAGIKRLHDFDQTGWLILLSYVPIASFVLLLFLLFKGPSAGLNRYGYAGSGSPFGA